MFAVGAVHNTEIDISSGVITSVGGISYFCIGDALISCI